MRSAHRDGKMTEKQVEMETLVAQQQRDLQQLEVNNQEIHNVSRSLVFSPFCFPASYSTFIQRTIHSAICSGSKKCYARA